MFLIFTLLFIFFGSKGKIRRKGDFLMISNPSLKVRHASHTYIDILTYTFKIVLVSWFVKKKTQIYYKNIKNECRETEMKVSF